MIRLLLILMIIILPVTGFAVNNYKVCTSGAPDCDYASLEDCLHYNEGILNDVLECEITEAFEDTVRVLIHNYTTSAENYISIYTTGSARHKGTWSTSYYRLVTASSAESIDIRANHVRIDGLQIHQNIGNDDYAGVMVKPSGGVSDTDIRFSNNILKANIGRYGLDISTSPLTIRAWNNIIYDFTDPGKACIVTYHPDTIAYLYNNTLENCNDGIMARYGTIYAKNNICQNMARDCYIVNSGIFDASSSNNISDDLTSTGGSNNQTNVTLSFVDLVGEDYHLDSSDVEAIDKGIDVSGEFFLDDIDGESRHANNWDIGADEYIAVDCTDLDSDGYGANGALNCPNGPAIDCDDNNANRYPGADDSNCNGVDEDCDSAVDEDYVTSPTSCGSGVCAASGQLICQSGTVVDTCTPGLQNEPVDVTCDGLDGDCDGTVDEDYVTAPTSCGSGVCAASGQLVCQGGTLVNTCMPGLPGTEGPEGDLTCSDVIDNDCDGQIDLSDSDCACIPTGPDNNCDSIDDDCDGAVDEDYVTSPTSCGSGVCAASGQLICQSGTLVNTCMPGLPGTEGPEGDLTCSDVIDNDCDGQIDLSDPDCTGTGIPYYSEKCFTVEFPQEDDDNVPIWSPYRTVTITNIYCRVEGGTSVGITLSDGSNPMEEVVCDSDGQADSGSIINNTFFENERVEYDTGSVTGPVNWLNVCFTYTIDEQ